MPQPVGWLTKAEIDAMLKVPDRKTPRGQSDVATPQRLQRRSRRFRD